MRNINLKFCMIPKFFAKPKSKILKYTQNKDDEIEGENEWN